VIDPTIPMSWCGRQTYGNVPAPVNVKEKVSPAGRVPESNTPVSEVTVWALCPELIQQTVVPTGIVRPIGLKTKSRASTTVVPAAHCRGVVGPVIAGVLPTSAQITTASVTAAKSRTLMSSPQGPTPPVPYARGGFPVFKAGTSGVAPNLDP